MTAPSFMHPKQRASLEAAAGLLTECEELLESMVMEEDPHRVRALNDKAFFNLDTARQIVQQAVNAVKEDQGFQTA